MIGERLEVTPLTPIECLLFSVFIIKPTAELLKIRLQTEKHSGPFTIVDSYQFLQSVLKGGGGPGPSTILFNVGPMRDITTVIQRHAVN